MQERLQKIIAESGLMSRRAAEAAISEGRVTVNGIAASLGTKAERGDEILLDGKRLPEQEKKQYYMLHKPRGYVCTMKDEKGRRTVRELLPAEAGRVYPVGRLDIMSEGLLLMSNDGDFTLRVTHPSGELHKTYRTEVSGDRIRERISRLEEPFLLDGVSVRPVSVRTLDCDDKRAVLEITIQEGRNREIRRICEIAGLRVERLIRVAEGPLKLGTLAVGKIRPLTQSEINAVMGK